MSKVLIGLAAIGVTAMLALPAPAVAKDRPVDGIRSMEQLEFSSSHRKHRRHVRRYWGPRYSYSRRYYYPYDAYAYSPYYNRPYYYRPGPYVGVGPWGFSFGFGY
jgi:hypothetical protein